MGHNRFQLIEAKKSATEALVAKALNFSLANEQDQVHSIEPLVPICPVQQFRSELVDKISHNRTQIIDPRHAIHSKIIPSDPLDRRNIWARRISQTNALHHNNQSNGAQNYNYLSIFYAYLIAAVTIGEIRQLANHEFIQQLETIREDTSRLFQTTLNGPSILDDKARAELAKKALAEGKGRLIDFMHSQLNGDPNTKEEVAKRLDRAKDWAGLERDALAVATIIDPPADAPATEQQRIIILDEPQTELTEEQKYYFENPQGQPWFEELNDFSKSLVMHYRGRILSGRCIIPSQLRSVLPVGKNAYRQSIFIQESSGELRLLNSYFHTGTVAHLSHQDETVAKGITNSNLAQQKKNSGADTTLMICLNSKIGDTIVGSYQKMLGNRYDADDSKIIELTKTAAEELQGNGVNYAKLCLNGFRKIEFNNYSGVNNIIAVIEANLRLIQFADMRVETSKEFLRKIESLLRHPADANLKALDIIYYLTQLAKLNNAIILDHREALKEARTVAIWFGCASGENRTSASYYHNILSSLLDYYRAKGEVVSEEKQKRLQDVVCNSQHIHIMTALGGTPGTEGIRGKSSGSLRSNYPINRLVTQTSDMKALPAENAEYNKALRELEIATKAAYLDRERRPLAEQAHNIIKHAREYTAKAYFDNDKDVYINAMQSATSVLKDPTNSAAFDKLVHATQRINAIPSQQDQPRFSRKKRIIMGISGALLGLAGLALIAVSVASIVTTCGVSTPLSVLGSILGYGLLADAIAFGVTGVVMSGASFGLLKKGLFSTKINAGTHFKQFESKAKQYQSDADRLDRVVRSFSMIF